MIPIIYSILLAAEVLIVGVLVSNAIPYAHNPLWDTLLIREQSEVFPNRDLQLYALFLIAAFGIYAGMLVKYRKRFENTQWRQTLKNWTWMQGLWVFVELYAAFKIIMDNAPLWARAILYLTLIVSFLNKIFWPESSSFVKNVWPRLARWVFSNFSGWKGNALAVLFIFCVIYIPDPQAVVAQLYMGDFLRTWDGSCLGAVYGLFNGLLPDVDVNSRYGFGIPVLMAGMMKLFGGFDYVNVIKSLVWLGIIYYVTWFFILRRWFYSGILAFAAILFGFRVAMFPMCVIPSIWNAMSESVLRLCFDALFFAFLYKHVTTHRKVFLWAAAAAAGMGMYHMFSTGLWLWAALLAYMGIHCIIPDLRPYLIRSRRDYFSLARVIFAAPVVMMALTWLTVKSNIFSPAFWYNVLEFHLFFAMDLRSGHLTNALHQNDFLFAAMGLGLVLFYAGSVLYAVHLIFVKKADHKVVLAVPLAVYGFCLHTYYVGTAMSFSTFSLPGIFLMFFWIDHACKELSAVRQKQIRAAILGGSCFAMISTPMFTAYPNLLNLSRNPIVDPNVAIRLNTGGYYFNQLYIDFPEWLKLPVNSLGEKDEKLKYEKDFQTDKQLIEYYKQDTEFSKDCDLIRRLTPEGSRVPLISSFEVLFLSEAKRKPFFYYFPYLVSQMMRTKTFPTTLLDSKTQLAKMTDQLEQSKPEYIFMERVLLTTQVPRWYFYKFEDLIDLIEYVDAHYQPEQTGQYLVAMKRVR